MYLGSLPYIINVPYIYDEYTAGEIPLNINLRQSSGPLNFVTLSEDYDKSVIEINPDGVTPGDFELQIESFDSESSLRTTLLTEPIIKITIKELAFNFDTKIISAIEATSWTIVEDSSGDLPHFDV
mgnify:FL=1